MEPRILVAVDDSPASARAVERGAELAQALAAELRLLHVVDLGWLSVGPELALDVEARIAAHERTGDELLAAALRRAEAAGVVATTKRKDTGSPAQSVADVVVAEAAEWGAGLVVVGTHGRRGLERLVLGSVAEAVARASEVPVLLVPGHAAAS
jgi:nucleotide-binding universal stress UspA family protein